VLVALVTVTVLVDGQFVPSVPAAVLQRGHVLAPPAVAVSFAPRVGIAGDTVWAERGDRRCSVPVALRGDPPLIRLAPLVRCLGGTASWDGATRTLAIGFGGPTVVLTPAPYDPNAPRVAPTTIFTPEPAPPTPRATVTGSPRPRRTPIPVVPSWPLPATSPRPRSP